MEIRIEALMIDSPEPDRLARFYERLLGWNRTYDDDGEIVIEDADGTSTPILFVEVDDPKVGKNRLHLDLRPDDQEAAVARALDLGASHTDIGQHEDPDVTWVVLADPDGNEFCILRSPRRAARRGAADEEDEDDLDDDDEDDLEDDEVIA